MFRPIRKKENGIGTEAAEQLLLHCCRSVLTVNGVKGYDAPMIVQYAMAEE